MLLVGTGSVLRAPVFRPARQTPGHPRLIPLTRSDVHKQPCAVPGACSAVYVIARNKSEARRRQKVTLGAVIQLHAEVADQAGWSSAAGGVSVRETRAPPPGPLPPASNLPLQPSSPGNYNNSSKYREVTS